MALETLDGKTAIVTGASAGIGRAAAVALASEGANVALAARREQRLEEIASQIESETDGRALVVPTDITEISQVQNLIDTTVEEFGGLDILVNNAGMGVDADIEEMSIEDYQLMMSVNTDGMFYTTREALPHLRESEGNLIFVGSFAAQYPRPGAPVYAATKWWARGFAHSLEGNVGPDGIGITVVNPTEVRTEFGSEDGDPFKERLEEGEYSEPEDIADGIVFAAKQESPNTVSELDLYRRDKFSHF